VPKLKFFYLGMEGFDACWYRGRLHPQEWAEVLWEFSRVDDGIAAVDDEMRGLMRCRLFQGDVG
jgi:hypothetical protein